MHGSLWHFIQFIGLSEMADHKHLVYEALHKLEEQLTCSICLDQYTNPKTLPPSFTINNLTEVYNLLKKVTSNRHTSCDNCNNTNADHYCKQCAKFLCQQCLHQHDKWITSHQTQPHYRRIDHINGIVSGCV